MSVTTNVRFIFFSNVRFRGNVTELDISVFNVFIIILLILKYNKLFLSVHNRVTKVSFRLFNLSFINSNVLKIVLNSITVLWLKNEMKK